MADSGADELRALADRMESDDPPIPPIYGEEIIAALRSAAARGEALRGLLEGVEDSARAYLSVNEDDLADDELMLQRRLWLQDWIDRARGFLDDLHRRGLGSTEGTTPDE